MTTDNERHERMQALENHYYQGSGQAAGAPSPGPYLFWLLAQLIDPSEVLFSDWLTEIGENGLAQGNALLITSAHLIQVSYQNMPEDRLDMQQIGPDPDTLRVTYQPVEDIASYSVGIDHPSLERKHTAAASITIAGDGWARQVPSRKIYNVAVWDYFQQVRDALSGKRRGRLLS